MASTIQNLADHGHPGAADGRAAQGASALGGRWQHRVEAGERLRLATLLASLYWLTQAGAALFPGTTLVDPPFAHPGQLPAQFLVDVVMLALALVG